MHRRNTLFPLILFLALESLASAAWAVPSAPAKWDGDYPVTFYLDGNPAGLSLLTIQGGRFTGSLLTADATKFQFDGGVRTDGGLSFSRLTSSRPGTELQAEGRLQADETISGTFSLDGRSGRFAGSHDNRAGERQVVTGFDGSYDLTFTRGGEVRASARCTIKNGSFSLSFADISQHRYAAEGYVLSDGTLILSSLAGDRGVELLAEGAVDARHLAIEGIYRIGTDTGEFSGVRLAEKGARP